VCVYAAGSDAHAIGVLKSEVLKHRDQIIKMADVQETSFYKVYPPSVFLHNQRAPPVGLNKTAPLPLDTSGPSCAATTSKEGKDVKDRVVILY